MSVVVSRSGARAVALPRPSLSWPVAVLLVALLATLALALAVVPAHARTSLDAVAASLRSDPVYNDPDAEEALSTADAEAVRKQIRDNKQPIFVAVLPASVAAEAGGTPESVLSALRDKVGQNGVYAAVVGKSFRAGSTSGTVKDIATQSFNDNKNTGVYAVLSAFVAGVNNRFGGSGASSGSGGFPWGWVVFGGLAAAGGGAAYYGVRKSRRAKAARLAEVKQVVDEDVTQLGERVALYDVNDVRLDAAGRLDMQNALNAYDRAKSQADLMASESDATKVTAALEDGRYALACVEARMNGQPVPERRPPCFVNPQHGPSVEDVMWAPDGGSPRPIPVCAACAAELKSGQLPPARTVQVGGANVPYWQAGGAYAPYARGYYSSWGDITPMILMTSHQTVMVNNHSGGGFGGGDFGGGGFFGGGGGDFGGGDFGGGDF